MKRLRLLTWNEVINDISRENWQTVFCGKKEECDAYAEQNGYAWKDSQRELFGGYYVGANGDCLMPDC